MKQTIRTGLIQITGESEFTEMRAFFKEVTSKLYMVREWGKNGVLDNAELVDLNKKFIPIIQNQEHISAILLAHDNGEEYFLQNGSPYFITRLTRQVGNKAEQHFAEWKSPAASTRQWQEVSDYDPRTRPWFQVNIAEDEIFVTDLYTFTHSGKKGITASVTWTSSTGKANKNVFGIDILRDEVQQLLSKVNKQKATILFLVNAKNKYLIPEDIGQKTLTQAKLTGVTAILPDIIDTWQKNGLPTAEPVTMNNKQGQWIASFQPLVTEQPVLWLGVLSNDDALLGALNASLFTLDIIDFIIAFGAAFLITLVMWLTGQFQFITLKKTTALERFYRYLAKGEGTTVEFKSTIRTNLKTQKEGKEIELAWLKALVAFLNSQGGALLLGVDDGGNCLGLDVDRFENEDKLLLHVKNLINHHVGAEFSSFISFSLLEIDEKHVLMIESDPTHKTPVFLKIGKNEEFYIRSGPSSVKLSPSQIVSYVLQRHGKKKTSA